MVLLRFLTEDSGAVTVDWTVLAAAVVGLGVATVGTVRSGTSALGTDINASLNSASVGALGELGDDGVTFAYSLLLYPPSEIANIHAQMTSWDNATVALNWSNYRITAQQYIADGNSFMAAHSLDLAHMMQLALVGRGVTPSTDGPSLESLTASYHATFG